MGFLPLSAGLYHVRRVRLLVARRTAKRAGLRSASLSEQGSGQFAAKLLCERVAWAEECEEIQHGLARRLVREAGVALHHSQELAQRLLVAADRAQGLAERQARAEVLWVGARPGTELFEIGGTRSVRARGRSEPLRALRDFRTTAHPLEQAQGLCRLSAACQQLSQPHQRAPMPRILFERSQVALFGGVLMTPSGKRLRFVHQPVGVARQDGLEEALHRGLGLRADELRDDAAVAERLHGGDAPDPKRLRHLGRFIHVHLREHERAPVQLCQPLQDRAERPARPAPGGPEVHDHGELCRAIQDRRGELRLGYVDDPLLTGHGRNRAERAANPQAPLAVYRRVPGRARFGWSVRQDATAAESRPAGHEGDTPFWRITAWYQVALAFGMRRCVA